MTGKARPGTSRACLSTLTVSQPLSRAHSRKPFSFSSRRPLSFADVRFQRTACLALRVFSFLHTRVRALFLSFFLTPTRTTGARGVVLRRSC